MKLTIALLFALTLAAQTGSGPNGSFFGNDFRRAYVPNTTLTGSGQTIGILSMWYFDQSDISANFAIAGLPVPNIEIVQLPMSDMNVPPALFQQEITMDILMASWMAPGATIRVYIGFWQDQILQRMAQDTDVRVFSSSFGIDPDLYVSCFAWESTCDHHDGAIAALQQMQRQGQVFLHAAGDYETLPIVMTPYVFGVGGSVLTTAPNGCRISEIKWAPSGLAFFFADATNIAVIVNGRLSNGGGSSAATPLWAGFLALVNQDNALHGRPPINYLHPTICLGRGICSPLGTTLIQQLGGSVCH